MRFIKELWHECLVYHKKCYNDIHKGAMPQVFSIPQEVLYGIHKGVCHRCLVYHRRFCEIHKGAMEQVSRLPQEVL